MNTHRLLSEVSTGSERKEMMWGLQVTFSQRFGDWIIYSKRQTWTARSPPQCPAGCLWCQQAWLDLMRQTDGDGGRRWKQQCMIGEVMTSRPSPRETKGQNPASPLWLRIDRWVIPASSDWEPIGEPPVTTCINRWPANQTARPNLLKSIIYLATIYEWKRWGFPE